MKGDVKNKLHPSWGPEVFLDRQPSTCGLRGASSLDRERLSLNRVQSDGDSIGLHLPVTSCIIRERFQPTKPSGLWRQPGFYLRLEAYGFIGLSEGDYRARRDSVQTEPSPLLETLPRTQCLKGFTDPDRTRRPFRFGADLSDDFRQLGVLSVPDRSELLSSIRLRSARPACALGLNGPSQGRGLAESDENSRA
jgi:hypothetical protein